MATDNGHATAYACRSCLLSGDRILFRFQHTGISSQRPDGEHISVGRIRNTTRAIKHPCNCLLSPISRWQLYHRDSTQTMVLKIYNYRMLCVR